LHHEPFGQGKGLAFRPSKNGARAMVASHFRAAQPFFPPSCCSHPPHPNTTRRSLSRVSIDSYIRTPLRTPHSFKNTTADSHTPYLFASSPGGSSVEPHSSTQSSRPRVALLDDRRLSSPVSTALPAAGSRQVTLLFCPLPAGRHTSVKRAACPEGPGSSFKEQKKKKKNLRKGKTRPRLL